MPRRDFTFRKYKEVCEAIKGSGYTTLTYNACFVDPVKYRDKRFILIRHDIDNLVDLPIALQMARYEASEGIRSTWYFRVTRDVFDPEIIREIYSLGHEIGYHYEVLNESGGDVGKAFQLLEKHLEIFRKVVPVTTICQHGGSLGEETASTFSDLFRTGWKMLRGKLQIRVYRSNDIWKGVPFEKYGLAGEAYLSLDFSDILYLSDTGLRWDGFKSRVLDVISTEDFLPNMPVARSTSDLIRVIREGEFPRINILAHPANWIDPFFPWLKWHMLQVFRNAGKRMLLKHRNNLTG